MTENFETTATKYEAKTESGSVYLFDLDAGTWTCNGETHRTLKLRAVPDGFGLSFPEIDALPSVRLPEVGKKLFVADIGYWRMSTVVVSVTPV